MRSVPVSFIGFVVMSSPPRDTDLRIARPWVAASRTTRREHRSAWKVPSSPAWEGRPEAVRARNHVLPVGPDSDYHSRGDWRHDCAARGANRYLLQPLHDDPAENRRTGIGLDVDRHVVAVDGDGDEGAFALGVRPLATSNHCRQVVIAGRNVIDDEPALWSHDGSPRNPIVFRTSTRERHADADPRSRRHRDGR